MVEIGDKVFVAPLYGQKDNMAIVTGPSGIGAELNEGEYNTWEFQWVKSLYYGTYSTLISSDLPDGTYNRSSYSSFAHFIDDKNDKIQMIWRDNNGYYRYGIASCSDFSIDLITPTSGYDEFVPRGMQSSYYMYDWVLGGVAGEYGRSRSIQSYTLISTCGADYNYDGLNIYRGSERLWSYCVNDDIPEPQKSAFPPIYTIEISTTGKYVLALTQCSKYIDPTTYYFNDLLLYKGTYV